MLIYYSTYAIITLIGGITMTDFGTKLKQLRKERRITQRDLADRTGIDFTYISKMENGKLENPPSEKTITNIAKSLGTDAEELLLLAQKVPLGIKDTIINDKLATAFLRKIPTMTNDQRNLIQKIIDEDKNV